jgi:4-hydroxybenzoate polyprenyltransferase
MDHVESRRAGHGLMDAAGDGRRDPAAAAMASIEPRPGTFMALAKSLRFYQWMKNLLIFVPLILGGKGHVLSAWAVCGLGFLSFGLLASASYLVNDLRDIASDRLHWSKRLRPLAQGNLPVAVALAAIPIGVVASFAIMASLDREATFALLGYGALTLLYSLLLKRLPIVDVLAIGILFTLRLVTGMELAKVPPSPWLLVFSLFIFTSLSLAKRYTEAKRSGALGREQINGRGYVVADAPLMFALGVSMSMGTVLIMVLYLVHEAFNAMFYRSPLLLWAIPPLLFLWVVQVWLLAGRDQLDDDPLQHAVTNKTSLALGALMLASFLAAWHL